MPTEPREREGSPGAPQGGERDERRPDAGAPEERAGARKQPYDEGYFGTEEEEGVVREREAPGAGEKEEPDPS